MKAPPAMREETSFEDWKKEIEVWRIFTDLPLEKQGPAVLLSLKGRAREAALELEIKDLSEETGLDLIIMKLDTLFAKDKDELAYEAYERFETMKRSPQTPIDEYLQAFDHLYNVVKKHGMVLPEGVLAYRLLASSNLPANEHKLARATTDSLTYKGMAACLKKIAGNFRRYARGCDCEARSSGMQF